MALGLETRLHISQHPYMLIHRCRWDWGRSCDAWAGHQHGPAQGPGIQTDGWYQSPGHLHWRGPHHYKGNGTKSYDHCTETLVCFFLSALSFHPPFLSSSSLSYFFSPTLSLLLFLLLLSLLLLFLLLLSLLLLFLSYSFSPTLSLLLFLSYSFSPTLSLLLFLSSYSFSPTLSLLLFLSSILSPLFSSTALAASWRCWEICRIFWPWCCPALNSRPSHHLEHVSGVWRYCGFFSCGWDESQIPPADWWGRGELGEGAGGEGRTNQASNACDSLVPRPLFIEPSKEGLVATSLCLQVILGSTI